MVPKSIYFGLKGVPYSHISSLRPKHVLYGYMEPEGIWGPKKSTNTILGVPYYN